MFRATGTAMMFRASAVLREQETWRDQGITNLQYLNVCTETTYACLKSEFAAKHGKWNTVAHRAQQLDDSGVVETITTIPSETAEYGKKGPKAAATSS